MTLNGGYHYREQLGPAAGGISLLDHLTRRHRHSPRELWAQRLAAGELTLDGRPAHGDEPLHAGQWLLWRRPPWQEAMVPLHYDLLYHDEALLAVAKPGGLPTLPGGGFLDHTLLSLVRQRFPEASPLHRLGRATSGLLLFARTRAAGSALSRAWREHEVKKTYRALASGVAEQDTYPIHTPIGPVPFARLGRLHAATPDGKPAFSLARVLERRAARTPSASTLFEVEIQTGRPHQIRIHLASIGHPLLGDPLYAPGGGPRAELPGLPGDGGYLLHAERLSLTHPLSGEPLELHAPVPAALQVGATWPE